MSATQDHPRLYDQPEHGPLDVLVSLIKSAALVTLALYASGLLVLLVRHGDNVYRHEVHALQGIAQSFSAVAPTGPTGGGGTSPVTPTAPVSPATPGDPGTTFILLCIAAAVFLAVLFDLWLRFMRQQELRLRSCRWVGFWGWLGCLFQWIVLILQFIVFILFTLFALYLVFINILAFLSGGALPA